MTSLPVKLQLDQVPVVSAMYHWAAFSLKRLFSGLQARCATLATRAWMKFANCGLTI